VTTSRKPLSGRSPTRWTGADVVDAEYCAVTQLRRMLGSGMDSAVTTWARHTVPIAPAFRGEGSAVRDCRRGRPDPRADLRDSPPCAGALAGTDFGEPAGTSTGCATASTRTSAESSFSTSTTGATLTAPERPQVAAMRTALRDPVSWSPSTTDPTTRSPPAATPRSPSSTPPPLPSCWPRAAGFVVAGLGMTDRPCC